MNSIIQGVRDKYPDAYKDIDDDQLGILIADKYPTYLDNEEFRDHVANAKGKVAAFALQQGTDIPNRFMSTITNPAVGEAAKAGQFAGKQERAVQAMDPSQLLAQARFGTAVAGQQPSLKDIGEGIGKVTGAITEPFSRVGSDLLKITGIDPSAEPGRKVIENFPMNFRPPGPMGMTSRLVEKLLPGVVPALEKEIGEAVGGFTEPGAALTIPFLAGEGITARAAALLFGSEQFAQLPETVQQSISTLKDPDASIEDKTRALAKPGIQGLLGATMMKHGTAGEAKPAVPTLELPVRDYRKPSADVDAAALLGGTPRVAEGARVRPPDGMATLEQGLEFAKGGDPIARSLEEKRVPHEAPIAEPTYPPSGLGRPSKELIPFDPNKGELSPPPSPLAPEYSSGKAAQALREQAAAKARAEDFNKAVAEKVAQAQEEPIHPDKPLTANQLRIIQESLRDSIAANQIPGTDKGVIAGSALDKWADDILKGGGTHLGPDVLAAYLVRGAATIERGVTEFAKWSDSMVNDLGEKVKPHLQSLFEEAKNLRAKTFQSPESKPEVTRGNVISDLLQSEKLQAELSALKTPEERFASDIPKQLEILKNKHGGKLPEMPKGDPDELVPALRTKDGKIIEGKRGNVHDDIYKGQGEVEGLMLKVDQPEHGFWDGKEFLSREQAAALLGEKEPLHSERLNELQAEKAKRNAPKVEESKPAAEAPTDFRKTLSSFGIVQQGIEAMVRKAAPAVRKAWDVIKRIEDETRTLPATGDFRKSILNWSAKLQRSFGEGAEWQKRIEREVRDPVRREAITNWIQAGGDNALLRQRANLTSDPKLRAGYEAAANLTPEEAALARDIKAKFGDLLTRGTAADVLHSFRENYVPQLWDFGGSAIGGGAKTLKEKFKFAKARSFESFFEGEQAGLTPKTKDISKLLPMYLHEMNSVIAARELAHQLSGGVASDGRPLVSVRGRGIPVTGDGGRGATLVIPKIPKGDTGDYKVLQNQPALQDWKWTATDEAGNPVLLKADLALHPDIYNHLRNVLGKSAIREWYQNKSGRPIADLPKSIAQALDNIGQNTKQTMLGFIAPFHQVQEGTHAIGHRVNPFFAIPKIDMLRNPAQMDAARHGLMINPDRTSADQFMQGLRAGGWLRHVPILGELGEYYSDYLFHQYIPGLKFKTYEHILERNNKVFANDLSTGAVKPEDVKILSAEQTNAAYGHLNYADLGRNPTIQHMMQIGLLAPDFLEARTRFTLQAAKGGVGAKVGREQLLALGTLAVAQAALSYTSAKLTGGKWDASDPFAFHLGDRKYTMRSVPEDWTSFVKGPRQFIYSRLSPIAGLGLVQGLSGVDYRGRKVKPMETLKMLAQQPIPINVRGFLGVGNSNLSDWEQLASSVGLKISRYSPSADLAKKADEWRAKAGPKQQADLERRQKETFAASDYEPLRDALLIGDQKKAVTEIQKLLQTKKPQEIKEALRPFSVVPSKGVPGEFERHDKPVAGLTLKEMKEFVKTLSPEDKKIWEQTKSEREKIFKEYLKALRELPSKKAPSRIEPTA